MQTIERELPWVQPLPSVKDHLFIGGLKRLFPASVLTGVGATGSRRRAAIGHGAKREPSLLAKGRSPEERRRGDSARYYGVLKQLTEMPTVSGVA